MIIVVSLRKTYFFYFILPYLLVTSVSWLLWSNARSINNGMCSLTHWSLASLTYCVTLPYQHYSVCSYLVITSIIFLLCFIARLTLVWILSPPTKSFASKQQEYPLSSRTFIRFLFTHNRSVSLNSKSKIYLSISYTISIQC